MASRPGVVFETKQEDWMNKDATEKQKNLINELLKSNPELNELLEYEDYKLNPTIANASEFLDAAKENMMNSEFEADTLVQYMAERPGVVKNEATHGLFSSGGTVDLEKAKEAVSNHPGNIWTNIISLRREDAHRLGYETQEAWKDAVYCALPDIQKAMKINAENFRWYAAFHDTGRHPHIHLMVYSADGKSGYLNKEGIKEIKRAFSTHIFADERAHIYSMKDKYRQEMRAYTEERIQNLIREIDANPTPTNAPALEKKMKQLSDALKDYKGKPVYQYLSKDIKALADDVMIEFSKDRRVHEIYSGWCNLENELQEMYKNNPDDPELLVNNKAFLPIKNEIIGQAHRLAKQTVFKEKAITLGIPEERVPWLSEEQTDALLRQAFEAENPEFSAYLEKAKKGDVDAQYKVGHLYYYGTDDIERDYREGRRWLKKAADGGHPVALFEMGKLDSRSKDSVTKQIGFEKLELAFRGLSDFAEYDIDAQKALAEYYQKGLLFEPYPEAAAYWKQRAADQNINKQASFFDNLFTDEENLLEEWYNRTEQGRENKQKNKAQASEWYQSAKKYLKTNDIEKAKEFFILAAEQGHSFAQYNLGRIYAEEEEACQDETLRGELMEQSQKFYSKALKEFLQSEAQTGDVMFQSLIARMYCQGLGTEPDFKKAFTYYLKAAEQDDPNAQYRVGRMFLTGEGTEKNITSAIKWLEKAAAQEEDGAAAYRLGKIYLEGREIIPDLNKARFWLEKAALTEKQFAPYALGKCYLSIARGMHETDYRHYCRLAMNCFITAGNAGNAYAVYQQGNMFLYGRGVERDFEKANLLFRQADSMGCEQARERVEQLNQKPTMPAAGIAGAFAAVLRMMSQNMEPSRLQPQQSTNRQQRIKESRLKDAQGIKME